MADPPTPLAGLQASDRSKFSDNRMLKLQLKEACPERGSCERPALKEGGLFNCVRAMCRDGANAFALLSHFPERPST
jgi:hypothetical protein